MKKLKTAADVPALVRDRLDASLEIGAVGDDGYCVIDLARPETVATFRLRFRQLIDPGTSRNF